jgi:MFS family permease
MLATLIGEIVSIEWSLVNTDIILITSMFSKGAFFGCVFCLCFSDRLGRKRILTYIMFTSALLFYILSGLNNYWVLIVV